LAAGDPVLEAARLQRLRHRLPELVLLQFHPIIQNQGCFACLDGHLLHNSQPEAMVGGIVVAGAFAVAFDERHRVELFQAAARRLEVLSGSFRPGGRVLQAGQAMRD
jgi:hypothetical protein